MSFSNFVNFWNFLSAEIETVARQMKRSEPAGLSTYHTPIIFIENQVWKCELQISIWCYNRSINNEGKFFSINKLLGYYLESLEYEIKMILFLLLIGYEKVFIEKNRDDLENLIETHRPGKAKKKQLKQFHLFYIYAYIM